MSAESMGAAAPLGHPSVTEVEGFLFTAVEQEGRITSCEVTELARVGEICAAVSKCRGITVLTMEQVLGMELRDGVEISGRPSGTSDKRSSVRVSVEKRTFRNWQNTIGGWISAFLMSALTIIWDPFAVYSTWEDGLQGFDAENILITAFFFTIAFVSLLIFAIPKVDKSGDVISVINPLHKYSFQACSIVSVTEGFTHTKITTNCGAVRAWGLELTNYELIGGDTVGPARRAAETLRNMTTQSQPQDELRMVRAVRRPSWPEIGLIAGWMTYVILGLT